MPPYIIFNEGLRLWPSRVFLPESALISPLSLQMKVFGLVLFCCASEVRNRLGLRDISDADRFTRKHEEVKKNQLFGLGNSLEQIDHDSCHTRLSMSLSVFLSVCFYFAASLYHFGTSSWLPKIRVQRQVRELLGATHPTGQLFNPLTWGRHPYCLKPR